MVPKKKRLKKINLKVKMEIRELKDNDWFDMLFNHSA